VVQTSGRGQAGLTRDARLIVTVQGLRAFAYGVGSVLIGVSLARSSLSGTRVGLVFAFILVGAAFASLALGRLGDRVGRRAAYRGLLVAMGLAGAAFAFTDNLLLLLPAALTGTVSTDVVESGPFTSLEQAMLPQTAAHDQTSRLFGTYNTVATLAGSLGALAAGAPALLGSSSPQLWLLVYPIAAVLALPFAAQLSASIEPPTRTGERRAELGPSRGIVRRMSALFALDSFGGGFVIQSFIAYWFSRKFHASPETLGVVFFGIGLLQAGSFQVAVRLAERIGLLRTMVFTHLPSNLLLIAVPFAPTLGTGIALLLGRFVLSQMDVPARQAYVVAVVDADERTAAAAYTNSARYAARPVAPILAGALVQASTLAAPFVIAGTLKSVYDLAFYRMFRSVPLDGSGRRDRHR
jgi:MFS family permease